MELTFITSALRRYAWVVVLCVLLAASAAFLVRLGGATLYRSEAVLLVLQPSESQLTVSVGGDADRYIAGQLSVLRSEVMAERVASHLGDGIGRREVASAVTILHEPGTDVVTIAADTTEPTWSQEIADAYVDVYFTSIRSQLDGTLEPVVESMDAEIESLRSQIEVIDQEMVEAVRPYLNSDPIPTLEQIAPGLLSEKQLLLTQLAELQSASTQMQFGPRVASEIVQSATLPTDPMPTRRSSLLPIAVVAGGFLGVLAAVVLARLSPNIVTDEQAEEILGHAVVGNLPEIAGLADDRRMLLDRLPVRAQRFVEGLAVRVGSTNPSGSPVLSVVVTGTRQGAGATTIAAALARYFADTGSRVVLVDADRQASELTQLYVEGQDPIPVSWTPPVSLESQARRREGTEVATLVRTPVPHLMAATLHGPPSDADGDGSSRAARHLDVPGLLLSLAHTCDVVVFDGGPLMSAVSTVQLVHHCDAVVLAMPRRQAVRGLEVVASELGGRSYLPVWTPAVRRFRRRRATPPGVPTGAPAEHAEADAQV